MTTTIKTPETLSDTGVVYNLKQWPDIISLLNESNDVCVVKMEALREIDGFGRLGVNVRQTIAEKLSSMGVGIIRSELPSDASANVILMRLGTPAAELVGILRSVAANEGRELFAAEALRKLNKVPDPDAVSTGIVSAIASLGKAIADTDIDLKSVLL